VDKKIKVFFSNILYQNPLIISRYSSIPLLSLMTFFNDWAIWDVAANLDLAKNNNFDYFYICNIGLLYIILYLFKPFDLDSLQSSTMLMSWQQCTHILQAVPLDALTAAVHLTSSQLHAQRRPRVRDLEMFQESRERCNRVHYSILFCNFVYFYCSTDHITGNCNQVISKFVFSLSVLYLVKLLR
jgi:hypothetical protein